MVLYLLTIVQVINSKMMKRMELNKTKTIKMKMTTSRMDQIKMIKTIMMLMIRMTLLNHNLLLKPNRKILLLKLKSLILGMPMQNNANKVRLQLQMVYQHKQWKLMKLEKYAVRKVLIRPIKT